MARITAEWEEMENKRAQEKLEEEQRLESLSKEFKEENFSDYLPAKEE